MKAVMGFACLTCALLWTASAETSDDAGIDFPRQWSGTYFHHDTPDKDYYEIVIDSVERKGSFVSAHGTGTYDDEGTMVELEVWWELDLENRYIQMREAADAGADYDDDAWYTGSFSRDMKTIVATWKNWANNNSGTIKLEAK